jgi:hypothetical protein
MADEKKKGPEVPAVAEVAPTTPADLRSEVAKERAARIAKHTAASDAWSKQWVNQGRDEKPTILVLVATPKGRPVKVGGRVYESHAQALVNRRHLRMLTGLSRRGVCQLIVGKVKLAGKE